MSSSVKEQEALLIVLTEVGQRRFEPIHLTIIQTDTRTFLKLQKDQLKSPLYQVDNSVIWTSNLVKVDKFG